MDHLANKEIVLVDKPAGITSYDVIRELKKRLAAVARPPEAIDLFPLFSLQENSSLRSS